ncbi:MAG: LON peptidase substrate-binding domain-containing protein [Candidatus Poseidoniaceae archaeon]|nr:LON peptidase substrate-binding domain-containing protein [Candidatus Poseidoniaceae archaeon]
MPSLPLFVLPMVLMPGEIQELRIFEPRYRQMLDDCLLDEKNFGLVMNDPFRPSNAWDGPRSHGCEAEILHHETKGSNHFVQIVGRRRFTVGQVTPPALPPFSSPMFETVLDDDGILPDVQELLEMIPDDAQHSKLYISADVEYHPLDEDISEEQQTILKDLMTHVLNRIGVVLRIEDELLEQWVAERVNRTVDHDADSVYAVAALILSTLEAKQNILASPTLDEAIEELVHHVALVQEEE